MHATMKRILTNELPGRVITMNEDYWNRVLTDSVSNHEVLAIIMGFEVIVGRHKYHGLTVIDYDDKANKYFTTSYINREKVFSEEFDAVPDLRHCMANTLTLMSVCEDRHKRLLRRKQCYRDFHINGGGSFFRVEEEDGAFRVSISQKGERYGDDFRFVDEFEKASPGQNFADVALVWALDWGDVPLFSPTLFEDEE